MPADSPPAACDLLIRNGIVVTLDEQRRVLDRGAIAVTGNAIAWVGPDTESGTRWRASRVLDANGGIIHPGFIDAHNHIVHNTCRGIFGEGVGHPGEVPFATWKADVTADD